MPRQTRVAKKEETASSKRRAGAKRIGPVAQAESTAKGQLRRALPSDPLEEILRKAQVYLLFEANRPMLWTVAGIRDECADDGAKRWIIAVHLRYPTGFEGYLGDLCFDGERFTELTDEHTMRQRAEQIAADPELIRQWNEYRASTLSPRET